MFHVKHAPPAADDNPLCGDRGTCYLPAGHYPMTAHEDAEGRWIRLPNFRHQLYNQRSNYQ